VTSTALTNPSDAEANVAVAFRYCDGGVESASPVTLASRAHQGFAIPGRFPQASNRAGVIEFNSNVDLSEVAFRFNPTGALTAFDPVRQARMPPITVAW
jgi:hypothetical protein